MPLLLRLLNEQLGGVPLPLSDWPAPLPPQPRPLSSLVCKHKSPDAVVTGAKPPVA